MNDITARTEDEMLIFDVSDEALEIAGGAAEEQVTSLLALALAYLNARVDRL